MLLPGNRRSKVFTVNKNVGDFSSVITGKALICLKSCEGRVCVRARAQACVHVCMYRVSSLDFLVFEFLSV